jgi:hypothetical protein
MSTQAELKNLDPLYTVYEVADRLKCSRQKVTRMFGREKGVIDIGDGETRYGKPHRVLRIPESVLIRVLESRKR